MLYHRGIDYGVELIFFMVGAGVKIMERCSTHQYIRPRRVTWLLFGYFSQLNRLLLFYFYGVGGWV